ncbi:glutathione synthetase, partial [Achromatium sp. WMS3]
QKRGWQLSYMELSDLSLKDNAAYGWMRPLEVADDPKNWFKLGIPKPEPLYNLQIILMRKDPPFNISYIMSTYLLQQAATTGVLVVNAPQSLRDANEKLFALQFPKFCPPTLVTTKAEDIRAFWSQYEDIILKPLDGMGGASVFRIRHQDPNLNVIIENLTHNGQKLIMVQRFIPEICFGDKRILIVDGETIPYALARMPAPGEFRGNLAAGGKGMGTPLSAKDKQIAHQVGIELKKRGILFAGLDIIGDYLTEINITSPTCLRELDKIFDLDIATDLLNACERRLKKA